MNVDPRNPIFRYIDKIILLAALVVAVLVANKIFSEQSPVVLTCQDVKAEVERFDGYVKNKPAPPPENILTAYAKLTDRFENNGISGHKLRDFVFYSPFDIILLPLRVQLVKSNSGEQKATVFEPKKHLPNADVKTMALTVRDKTIAELTVDKENNTVLIKPRKEGTTIVRMKFIEGSSIEFALAVVTYVPPPKYVPEPPQVLTATPRKGYNVLKWQTNERSSPLTTYRIFRTRIPKAPEREEMVAEVAVMDRELPEKLAPGEGAPAEAMPQASLPAKVQEYEWYDSDIVGGVTSWYTVQGVGMVKDERDGKDKETESATTSKAVSAVALNPIVLTLTYASTVGETASIEVERWQGFVPRFKTYSQVRRGEAIGSGDFATGYVLIDFDEGERDVAKRIRKFVEDDNGVMRMVETDDTVLEKLWRGLVANDKGEGKELWRERSHKSEMEKSVDRLFSDYTKGVTWPSPKPIERKQIATKGAAEVLVKNDAAARLLFAVRGRCAASLYVPAYTSLTLVLDDGQYELLAAFGEKKAFHDRSKHTLKGGRSYEIVVGMPTQQPEGAAAP